MMFNGIQIVLTVALLIVIQGMVDAGEQVSTTLKREFMEEAMSNTSTKDVTNDITKDVTALFSSGHEVYSCSM